MDASLQSKVQDLGDLELAILVCMVAQEHCIFSTDHSTQDLKDELHIICRSIFGTHPAVIQCSPGTSIDEFSEGILVEPHDDSRTPLDERRQSYGFNALSVDFSSARGRQAGQFGSNTLDTRRIADVIIAVDLDLASETVQVQTLELLRTRRIFTRAAMHTASKDFMVLAVMSKPGARLSKHLNDVFCMSHFHPKGDGWAYLSQTLLPTPLLPEDISHLRHLAENAQMTPELAAYLHNIVVFMRNNRYISGGVTATATRQLRAIAKVLAPLHGLDYVPPSLIALAVHKIYPHRLILATAKTERSLQWGSDVEAVKRLLEGVTVEDAIEDVLASVETPL